MKNNKKKIWCCREVEKPKTKAGLVVVEDATVKRRNELLSSDKQTKLVVSIQWDSSREGAHAVVIVFVCARIVNTMHHPPWIALYIVTCKFLLFPELFGEIVFGCKNLLIDSRMICFNMI